METIAALSALSEGNPPVTGRFPVDSPLTKAFFDLRLNKRLSKQSRRLWSEASLRSLWRRCNAVCLLPCTHWQESKATYKIDISFHFYHFNNFQCKQYHQNVIIAQPSPSFESARDNNKRITVGTSLNNGVNINYPFWLIVQVSN